MSTIDEQIKALQEALTELKAKVAAKEVKPMFEVPEIGSDYYHVSARSVVQSAQYDNDYWDEELSFAGRAFTSQTQAQACADYLKDNFWFIRKAIEFADGYEFTTGASNSKVRFDNCDGEWQRGVDTFPQYGDIHMSERAAVKFCEWLNEHKPNGWK